MLVINLQKSPFSCSSLVYRVVCGCAPSSSKITVKMILFPSVNFGVIFQIFAAVILSYLNLLMGLFSAWPSSTVSIFTSANTTLQRPMTETEVAWMGSLPCVGALVATPIAGMALDKFGRKNIALFTSVIYVIGWTLVASSARVEAILTAMFLAGLANAVFMVTIVYVSEICQDSIRGALTAFPIQFFNAGILVSYLVGGRMDYYGMIYVFLGMSVAGVLMVAMLKETPVCLMAKGLEKEAAESISFYRRIDINSKELTEELEKIRHTLNPALEGPEKVNVWTIDGIETNGTKHTGEKKSAWQFFKESSSTRKGFYLSLMLVSAFNLQGYSMIQVFAEPIFEVLVPSAVMSPNTCTVLSGSVALVAGLAAACLTDVFGRRPLMIYSSTAAGVCIMTLAIQHQLQFGPGWLPAVLVYIYNVFFQLGAGTVPFVIAAEVFLPEVKSVLSMLAIEFAWLGNWLTLFVFPSLMSALGLTAWLWFFGAMCFLTTVYCWFCLPETKGLPMDKVQEALVGNKKK